MYTILELLLNYRKSYLAQIAKEKEEAKRRKAGKTGKLVLSQRNKEVLRAAFILERFTVNDLLLKLQSGTISSLKYHLDRLKDFGYVVPEEKRAYHKPRYWMAKRAIIEREKALD